MATRRLYVPTGIALLLGLVLGALFAGVRAPRLLAHGGDRWGDTVVASGAIGMKFNPITKAQVIEEAIYYLNYTTGKLLVSVPSMRQGAAGTQVVGEFAERDLVRDFGLAPGTAPHFLMTTASLGSLGDGTAPLFVFETTTGQVAVYRVTTMIATANGTLKPTFELLERRTDPHLGRPAPR
ncbi:MAG: hypothetical protein ABI353_19560 [Isosphaeraceae bacterium]